MFIVAFNRAGNHTSSRKVNADIKMHLNLNREI